METNVIKIKLWNYTVGYLTWDKRMKLSIFEYEKSFLQSGLNISPLVMSIYSPRSQKDLPWLGHRDKLYQGLPPMIADSLPDKWGNSLFKAWLRDKGISTKKTSPIDHLSFIGCRAMGALEFEPANAIGDSASFSVDVQNLYQFANQVLNQRKATVLNKENSMLWQDLIKISSSPGGKRPKAIVAINNDTGEVIAGQADIPKGFRHYILKYDDNSAYPYAKLEYIYFKMAIDAGIKMMQSELREYGDITHFLTMRFDRHGNEKIHTQTLAAIWPLATSYEDLFTVIRKLNLPYEDCQQQYLRTVFNVITRNVDDHNKNVSFCMNQQGKWRLSPAYDLTFSVDLAAPDYSNVHELTINEKNEYFDRKDLEALAIANDITDYNTLINQVTSAAGNFERYAADLDISKELTARIKAEFVKV